MSVSAPTSIDARLSAHTTLRLGGPASRLVTAADAAPPAGDVPEADALEQQLSALPRVPGGTARPVGDREANEADVVDQETDVPLDDDDLVD